MRHLRRHRPAGKPIPDLDRRLEVMSELIAHRGPDDAGVWTHERGHVGLAHRRLSIIDLEHGHQPMSDERGRWITYNGEIYNYPELRREIGAGSFRTTCDTEVVLRAHDQLGHRRRSTGCAACSPTRCGTSRARSWSAPATASGSSRSTTPPSATSSTSPPRPRRCCRSCPRSRPTSTRSRTTWRSSSASAGKTLFKGVEELLPGHFLRVGRGAAQARALLGGLLRPRLRPHRALLRGADRGAARGVGASCTCAATCRSPPTSAAASTRAWSRRLASAHGSGAMQAFTGQVLRGRALRREPLRAGAGRASAAWSCTRSTSASTTSSRNIGDVDLPPRLPGRRARLVPAVHGLPGGRARRAR